MQVKYQLYLISGAHSPPASTACISLSPIAHSSLTTISTTLPLLAAEEGSPQPVHKEWLFFDFHDRGDGDGIIFCQRGSAKLLFAQLPQLEGDTSNVFLFGSHQGEGWGGGGPFQHPSI